MHFGLPEGNDVPRPGDFVTVTIGQAAPFHLIADGDGTPVSVRRSAAGDAWDRAQAASCELPAVDPGRTSLGMPALRAG